LQFKANPSLIAISTARLLSTGKIPGRPKQTGQTLEFGFAPYSAGQEQKSFESVFNWA
jgi:hypothetical protein